MLSSCVLWGVAFPAETKWGPACHRPNAGAALLPSSVGGTHEDNTVVRSVRLGCADPESRAPNPDYFALMITVFTNASPMLSDVASPRSATAMCTMRRS